MLLSVVRDASIEVVFPEVDFLLDCAGVGRVFLSPHPFPGGELLEADLAERAFRAVCSCSQYPPARALATARLRDAGGSVEEQVEGWIGLAEHYLERSDDDAFILARSRLTDNFDFVEGIFYWVLYRTSSGLVACHNGFGLERLPWDAFHLTPRQLARLAPAPDFVLA